MYTRLPSDVLFLRKRANVDMRLKLRLEFVLSFLRGSASYSYSLSRFEPPLLWPVKACPESDADEARGKATVEHEKERERRVVFMMPSDDTVGSSTLRSRSAAPSNALEQLRI